MPSSGVGCGWGWVCICGRRATTSSTSSWTRPMTEPALAFNVRGRGRHYRHPVTGEEVPSVTNVIGVLDKPALPRWAAKVVAEQAWLLRGTLDELGRDEAVDVLKGAPWRKSTRAADRGTTIHDYLHARAQGVEPPDLDGEAAKYRKAVDGFLDLMKPEFLMTFFFSSRRRHTGCGRDWSSDVCSSDLDFSGAQYWLRYFAERMLALDMPEDVDVLKIDVPAGATPDTPWRITRLERQPYFRPLAPERTEFSEAGPIGYELASMDNLERSEEHT